MLWQLAGSLAMLASKPRQIRKEAAVVSDAGAEMWLVRAATFF